MSPALNTLGQERTTFWKFSDVPARGKSHFLQSFQEFVNTGDGVGCSRNNFASLSQTIGLQSINSEDSESEQLILD